MKNTHTRSGFTLIELSIVLVIIGLIVGGVLVGRDLIKAAEIRGTISQKEQFDAAVNTFFGKYNCLPGDCKHAVSVGLGAANDLGDNGSGDDYINWGELPEMEYFWYHLLQAKLINFSPDYTDFIAGGYSLATGAWGVTSPATKAQWSMASDPGNPGTTSPSAWGVFHTGAYETMFCTAINDCGAGMNTNLGPGTYFLIGTYGAFPGEPVPPIDAFTIDSKLDDGLPMNGTVQAFRWISGQGQWGIANQGAAGAGNDFCITNASTPLYNAANTSHNFGSLCSLAIRASF